MNHNPRKRFGQNFLIDNNIIDKIVQSLNPQPGQHCVEIGPGLGAITERVLRFIDHLDVIEIDRDLSAKLQEKYSPQQLTVYEQDALRFNFLTLCPENSVPLRIFGNLPYNISTPLLFHFLSYAHLVSDMLFMLQKEVVMRMCAAHNTSDYGRLSVMIQYACKVTRLFDIQPSSFSPAPKVTSCMVHLVPYQQTRPHPLAQDEKMFSQIVAVAFQQRRKTLKNCLQSLVPPSVFEKAGIDAKRRAETLSVAEFVLLANTLRDCELPH
jgi:16S rRNA (adenine1518-N6/adenine1519-N6)-dimethyltransferase